VGLIDFLLRRQPDPTKDWPEGPGTLPPVRLKPFALGSLRLDDHVESARFLGRPDRVRRWKLAGSYQLAYEKQGLTLEFEAHRLCEVGFAINASWLVAERLGPCKVRLEGGGVLSGETTLAEVKKRFGPPVEEDVDEDDGEILLRYKSGQQSMEVEFEDGRRLSYWSVVWD
jgi:hypothetical protein